MKEKNQKNQKKKAGKDTKYDWSIKVSIFGDSSVGKHAMVRNFCNIKARDISFAKEKVLFEIPGIVSTENFTKTSGSSSVPHDVNVAILAYDITSSASLQNIVQWKKKLECTENKDTVFILVGNKIDLKDRRVVSHEAGHRFSEILKCDAFMECNAKNKGSIEMVFFTAASKFIDRKKSRAQQQNTEDGSTPPVSANLVLNTAATLTRQRLCTAGLTIFIIGALLALAAGAWIGMAALGVVGAAALVTKALFIAGGATLGLGGVLGVAGLFQKKPPAQVTAPSDGSNNTL